MGKPYRLMEPSNLSSYAPSAYPMFCMEALLDGHDSAPYVHHTPSYPHKAFIRFPYAPIRYLIRFYSLWNAYIYFRTPRDKSS